MESRTAAQKLAPVLSRAWFAEALLPRLAFGEITEDEAITASSGKIIFGRQTIETNCD